MDTVIAMPRVSGSKGFGKSSSGSSGSHEDPNTLRSNVRARIIDLWGEGVFEGFVSDDLRKDVFFDRTPVMNADGTLNFPGVTIDYRLGLADQEELKGFPMVEAPYSVGARVYKNQGPIVRTISDRDATSVRVIVTIPALNYTNKTEKFAGLYKASVNYAFDVKTATGDWVEAINTTINDKCTSPYQRAHRVDLPAGGYPWQVRMRRISPDSTDDALQDQTVWDSYVEVVEARLTYMHSAVAALEVDARQFGSSVPNRSYRVRGRKWEVPSNYDPITRTYTGLWDGSWVEKWTNNPAYVFRGLALQDRFGLGEFVDRAKIDDAGIYQIGQYCDQGVDDGFGRLVPRYTFNGVLNTFKEAHKAMQDIAATFRGMSFWTLGQIFAVADMPKDPVLLVTKANTIGGFEYSSTAMKARHTAASVAWNDPDDFYKPGLELYRDPDGVRQFGWRQADVQLEGCTVRAQAYRMGAWLVDTELNEFETVTYRASFDHAALDRADVVTGLLPGDIIQIADPRKMRVRAGGRVVAAASTTRVQLDAPFPMVAGQTYKLRVTRPNGKIAEAGIASIDANNIAILNAPLPELPLEEAVWMISGTDAAPRQYRVLEVAEEAKNVFRVTGLFYDPTKYDRVEKGIKLPTIAYTRPRTQIAPPTNLAVRESQYFRDGQPRTRLTLSWTPGNDFMSAGYLITAQTPAGFQSYGETGAPTIDIDDAQPGDWVFTVVGRSNTPGVFSPPEDFAYVAKGWAGTAGPTISNLRIQGGGTIFSGRDASLLWDVTWPADAQTYDIDFVVRVLDAGTDQVVRVASTASPNWSYTFETNANDGRAGGLPGPRRAFKVRVSARDLLGREATAAILSVSNPAPAEISPTLRANSETLFVTFPAVTDLDFAGYLVWVSETPNLNPLTLAPFEVTGSFFTYAGKAGQTLYVRGAAFDAFGKDPATLNIGPEQSQVLTLQLFDPLAPPIPGQPTASANVAEVAPDGTVTSKVIITWPGVTSDNLGTYEVAIAEGNNPAEAAYVGGRFSSGGPMAFAGLMPGRVYSFKVRSNPKNGFADSGWSPVLVVTAAANTTAPANPTDFTVTAAFEGAQLKWTAPTTADLRHVEVWGFDGSSTAATPPAGSVLIDRVGKGSTGYADRLPTTGTRTYWLRSVNTSGVVATSYVRGGPVSTAALSAAQLQAGVAESLLVANQIALTKNVTALPATKTYDYVAYQGKTYRWDATAAKYTAEVAASDIAGKITAGQIDTVNKEAIATALAQSAIQTSQLSGNLNAARIAGQITADQIENRAITAAKFAEGLDAIQSVDSLPNLATWTGPAFVRLRSDGKLYRIVSGAWTKNVDISDTVGTVPEDRLPAFNAANLYGTLDEARIASVAAGKITGTLSDSQLAAISAAKITGTISSDQIATIAAAKITGAISSDQIAGLVASKIAGQITGTQITDQAITTAKLGTAAVQAGNISAGSILTSHLTIASANMAYNPDLSQGTRGWSLWSGTIPSGEGPFIETNWAPAGYRSVFIRSSAPAAQAGGDRYLDLDTGVISQDGARDIYAVRGSNWYEFSACISAHRCSGRLVVQWLDSTKNTISFADGADVLTNNGGDAHSGLSYRDFPKSRMIAQAPANAVYARPFFRMDNVIGDNPHLFVSAFMMAGTAPGAVETSPYVAPGVTTLDGSSIITGSLHANRIVANSIEAEQINSNAIQTRHILAGAIETVHMDAGSINASVLVAQSILAEQIASDSIRTRHIMAGQVVTSHMTAGSIDASVLVAQSIKARHIGAGEIVASRLGIVSANLAFNPDLSQGTRGWTVGSTMPSTSDLFIDGKWCPSGYKAIAVMSWASVAAAAGQYCDVHTRVVDKEGNTSRYPVVGGQTYEYSICVSNHRCSARLYLQYFDANGVHAGYGGGMVLPAPSEANQPAGGTYATFPKLFSIEATPGNAVSVIPFVRMEGVVGDAPHLFLSAFMMAATRAGATETSPYVAPGTTVIDGSGIITNSVQAGKIVAGSITTRELNVGNIFADSAVISNISSRVLITDAIKSDMILAGQITTSKLAIVSSNMAFNPDLSQGLRGWTQWNGSYSDSQIDGFYIDNNWCPDGFRAVGITTNDTGPAPDKTFGIRSNPVDVNGNYLPYAVRGGLTYEFSAFISIHRCSFARLQVNWRTTSGDYISSDFYDMPGNLGGGIGGSPSTYPRIRLVAKAPANATQVDIYFNGISPNATDPYIFISGFMLASCPEGTLRTETSPYVVPGITTIDGSTINTGTVVARHIKANEINAGHIVTGGIDAKVIIATESITTAQLGANSVEAKNVKAGAITAGKLTLTDTSNMVLNGSFNINGTPSLEGWSPGATTVAEGGLPADDPGGPQRLRSTDRDAAWSNQIACSVGDVIYASAMNANLSSYTATLYVVFYKGGNADPSFWPVATRPAGASSWARMEGRATCPPGYQYFSILLQTDRNGTGDGSNCYWGRVQARRAASAELIVDGSIDTRHLKTDTLFANQGVIDNLRSAIANFGALGADQIQAGAIGADKLAIGFNTGNILWNSDFAIDQSYSFYEFGGWPSHGFRTDWSLAGTRAVYVSASGVRTGDHYALIDLQYPSTTGNGWTSYISVQPGEWYEFSAYVSAHRCQARIELLWVNAAGTHFATSVSNWSTAALQTVASDDWRCKMRAQAPVEATQAVVRLLTYGNGGSDPYAFFSGLYLGKIPAGLHGNAPYAAYVPASRTVIHGGALANDSIETRSLKANTITSDHISVTNKIQAGKIVIDGVNGIISAINVNAEKIQAGKILVGDGDLNSLIGGWNSTKINGGAIQTNTISAQRLNINTRGITPVNINFGMERDGNGNPTNVLYWTSGQIEYIDDNGNRSFVGIPAGSVARGGDGWATVWWDKSAPGMLWSHQGNNTTAVYANPNCVLVATTFDPTGVTVNWGGVIIDGDKIIANSIQARNIAADAIQTKHMAANSIQGDRIVAGSLDVAKLAAGTISTGSINIGSGACVIDSGSRMLRMYNEYNGVEQVSIGQVGRFYGYPGDAGIVIRNVQGAEVFRVSGAGAWMSGAIIDQIQANQINTNSLSALDANLGRARSNDGKFVIDFNSKYLAIWD